MACGSGTEKSVGTGALKVSSISLAGRADGKMTRLHWTSCAGQNVANNAHSRHSGLLLPQPDRAKVPLGVLRGFCGIKSEGAPAETLSRGERQQRFPRAGGARENGSCGIRDCCSSHPEGKPQSIKKRGFWLRHRRKQNFSSAHSAAPRDKITRGSRRGAKTLTKAAELSSRRGRKGKWLVCDERSLRVAS